MKAALYYHAYVKKVIISCKFFYVLFESSIERPWDSPSRTIRSFSSRMISALDSFSRSRHARYLISTMSRSSFTLNAPTGGGLLFCAMADFLRKFQDWCSLCPESEILRCCEVARAWGQRCTWQFLCCDRNVKKVSSRHGKTPKSILRNAPLMKK